MTHDAYAPATKGDLEYFARNISEQMDGTHHSIHFLYKAFYSLESSLDARFEQSEERMTRYFNVALENMRDDILGAYKDDIENVKIRVTRLEAKV